MSGNARIVRITPELARTWLKLNVKNRRVRVRHVDSLVSEIVRGNWEVNGETIKFSDTGNLLDGQHRLEATVKSGKAIDTWVVWGVKESAQTTMDTGAMRQAADALSLVGSKNSVLLGSTVKLILLHSSGVLKYSRQTSISTPDILKWVSNNPDIAETILLADGLRRHIECPPSAVGAAVYLCRQADPNDTRVFFERLANQTNLSDGDPILALIKRQREIRNNKTRTDPLSHVSMILRTWNSWRKGTLVKQLKALNTNGEPFRIPEAV